MRGILCLLFTAGVLCPALVCAQTPAAPLSFEVATIKPAPNDIMALAQQMQSGKSPFRIDDHVFRITFTRTRDLIAYAYEIPVFEVTGPDALLDGQRWEINATMPAGSTSKDAPKMMQTLLAERFGLKFHRESKDQPVYVLTIAKDGLKMKEAPPDEPQPAPAPGESRDSAAGPEVKPDGKGGATINAGPMGNMKINMSPEGLIHMEMSRMSMPQLVQQLTPLLDHPVVDKTELKGNYQVAFDIPMSAIVSIARAQGINMPGLPPGGGGAGPADTASDPAAMNATFKSMEKLGLKLDPRKEPVSDIIVDHVEKTPTEN
jgi:uncharacterized protein (TIGR03435 family)